MLFVSMYSWDKEKRDEVIKRRLERGVMIPSGIKRIGEWTAIGRRVGFSVTETDDPKLLVQANMAWNDIVDYDIFPVLDTEKDLLGLLKG